MSAFAKRLAGEPWFVPAAFFLVCYAAAIALSGLPPESLLARFRMDPGLFAYSLVSLFLIALTGVAAALTRRAAIDEGATTAVASAVVLALWLSPPVLSNAFLVFPEVFALLLTAWIVRLAAGPTAPALRTILLSALALGLLPWLHRKFAIYALALGLALAWRWRDRWLALTHGRAATAITACSRPCSARLAAPTWCCPRCAPARDSPEPVWWVSLWYWPT